MKAFDPISFERDMHLITDEQLEQFIQLADPTIEDDRKVMLMAADERSRRVTNSNRR